jgi:hypothetical protein
MKRTRIPHLALAALVGLLLGGLVFAAQEKANTEKPQKEEFSGRCIMWAAGPLTGKTGRLFMTVDRWTTNDERMQLYKALKEGGPEAFRKAMEKTTAGYVRTSNSLRYPLSVASSFQTDKGRKIRLVTTRPILWSEVMGATRSEEYEYGVIEFTLDEKGKGVGEGVVVPMAKVYFDDKGQLVVENLGTGPQKLLSVSKD